MRQGSGYSEAAMRLETEEVAGLLKEFGLRTALKGGNPYRSKAYVTAAQNLKSLGVPLDEAISKGLLKSIPGIGDAIEDIIVKLHRQGTHPKLEEMRRGVPASLLEMLEIPKVRPEDILKVQNAGISTLVGLEKALKSGRLDGIKGFTPSFQRKLLEGMEIHDNSRGKIHLHRAQYLMDQAKASLERRRQDLRQVTIAGDLRRCCELVGDLSLVAIGRKTALEKVNDVALRICAAESYGAALLLATGSESHVGELVKLAAGKGLKLDESGLWKGKSRIAGDTEEGIYKALGLSFIPPELREGRGEIARAKRNKLHLLVEPGDVRGILHAHTVRSDGAATLAEMVEACSEKGFSYLGITEHSQTAHYAGGLHAEEVLEQQAEIDRMNKRRRSFRIFKGIESDILVDGSLDYPDAVLKTFDFVVASIHGQFRKSSAEQTARMFKAIANPYTTILGHITGRQLLRRHGYDVDIEKILKACAKHDVAIEVNGHPWRLDIDWRWLQAALDFGCMISLDPDAHSVSEIDNVRWSVAMARKGGVPRERIINCMDVDAFAAFLKQKKRRLLH